MAKKTKELKLRGDFYPVSLYLKKDEKEWLSSGDVPMNKKARRWIQSEMKKEKKLPANPDWEDDLHDDLKESE